MEATLNLSSASLDPQPISKQSEYEKVSTTCTTLSLLFQQTLQTSLNWQKVFYLILEQSEIRPEFLPILNHSLIFTSIKPVWPIQLSKSCFNLHLESQDPVIAIKQIIDFAKGRFWIELRKNKFLAVLPLFNRNFGLFAIIIKNRAGCYMFVDRLNSGTGGIAIESERLIEDLVAGGKEVMDIDDYEDLIQTQNGYEPKFVSRLENDSKVKNLTPILSNNTIESLSQLMLKNIGLMYKNKKDDREMVGQEVKRNEVDCVVENLKNASCQVEILFLYEFPAHFKNLQISIVLTHSGQIYLAELVSISSYLNKVVYLVKFCFENYLTIEYVLKLKEGVRVLGC